MAEGILRTRWIGSGRDELTVSSMGIHGLDHQPACEPARRISLEHDVDISGHFSQPLSFETLNRADLVFCMEMVHKDFILLFLPQLVDRVFLLAAWPDKDTPKANIRDPMGGSGKDFRIAFETIAGHIDRLLPLLQAKFS
jgi:protein-tyrosine-phosphatase